MNTIETITNFGPAYSANKPSSILQLASGHRMLWDVQDIYILKDTDLLDCGFIIMQQEPLPIADSGPINDARPQRKKPGRKRIEGGTSKRQEQMRGAQRVYRERKQQYIKDLEDTIADQKARLALYATENSKLQTQVLQLQIAFQFCNVSSVEQIPIVASCVNCVSEKLRADLLFEKVKTLENTVLSFEVLNLFGSNPSNLRSTSHFEQTNTNQFSSVSNINGLLLPNILDKSDESSSLDFTFTTSNSQNDNSNCTDDMEWLDTLLNPSAKSLNMSKAKILSATELYGPVEYKSLKIAASNLPSFQQKPEALEIIINAFLAQARSSTRKDIARNLLKIERGCEVFRTMPRDERRKWNEIVLLFIQRNKHHILNLILQKYLQGAVFESPNCIPTQIDPKILSADIQTLKHTLVSLPSLNQSGNKIDELCALFEACNLNQEEETQDVLAEISLLEFQLRISLAAMNEFEVFETALNKTKNATNFFE
ncbi:hypothetical protein HK100_007385, partial [Physocladia obscura]